MRVLPVVALFALAGLANAATGPGKVVELLNELKAKMEGEGAAEQKLYDKFACYCEKTTAEKAANIESAKNAIEELSHLINELQGSTGGLRAAIKQLNKDIAANQAAQAEATSIRQKENEDYSTFRAQSEQTIGALEHAVKTLTGAGEGASALQQAEILSVGGVVRSALRRLPHDGIPADQLERVEEFVKDPAAFFAKKSPSFSGAQLTQNPFGDYAPASTAIQGTLKSMYDEFTSKLESANAEEGGKQKMYEELMATKKEELEALQKSLETKTTNNGGDLKALADSKEEKDATEKQLADDEAFFEDTKEACKARADEWAEASRLRTEELAGINEAIKILGDGAENLDKATGFLQTGADQAPQGKAYKALKAAGRKSHSLRLLSLASEVKTTEKGHFNKVIQSIDKMIADLRGEEQDDIDHRDWCQEEENKHANQIGDLEYKVGQKEALIERLEAKSGELETAIQNTEAELLQTQENMAEALAQRNEESDNFKEALADDTEAIATLQKAGEALGAFEKNNAAFVQTRKGKGGPGDQKGGIESIIAMLKEDLENEVKLAKASESESQANFNKGRAASRATINALKEKRTTQALQKADTDQKTAEADRVKESTKKATIEKHMEADSIEPNCSWIKGAFEERRTKRKTEIEGLITAKAVLAGQAPSFLQKRN